MMEEKHFTPREVSGRHGIQTSKLRKFVDYFPDLFSESAHLKRNRRYSNLDIRIFKRIRKMGDRLSLLSPDAIPDTKPLEELDTSRLEALTQNLDSIVSEVRLLQEKVSALMTLSRVEWAHLSESQDALISQQTDVLERLDRVESEMGMEKEAIEYRRRPSGSRWHWIVECPHFPKDGEFIIKEDRPLKKELCSICLSKVDEG